jgi:hypothetical protein
MKVSSGIHLETRVRLPRRLLATPLHDPDINIDVNTRNYRLDVALELYRTDIQM